MTSQRSQRLKSVFAVKKVWCKHEDFIIHLFMKKAFKSIFVWCLISFEYKKNVFFISETKRNNVFTRVKPIKKYFFYLLWNQVKTFFQEKTFFSLPWVKPRQSMFFHVWHKKPFSQQKETFFSAEKLIFRRETWETELKPSTVKQKESMFVQVFFH